MATEFVFDGETLTLATQQEMQMAILRGKFLSRKDGISTYRYRGQKYLVSDHDLGAAGDPAHAAPQRTVT